MTRPLYLDQTGATVALDGPALRVATPDCSDRWFPLVRLSRVVCRLGVEWSTEALLACAEHGVGVTFADEHGEVLALWISALRAPADLNGLLLDLAARPDALERWENWLAAQHDLAVTSAARRCRLRDPYTVRPADLLRWLRQEARRLALEGPWLELGCAVRAPLTARIVQRLKHHDLALERLSNAGLRLEQDLTECLLWDFHLPALRHLQHHPDAIHHPRLHAAALCQQREDRTDRLVSQSVIRLRRFLLEQEPWC